MSPEHPVARWHALLAARDPHALNAWLADDATFHSPVLHTPQHGKALVVKYLAAALQVIATPDFRYVREIVGERDACLEFTTVLDEIHVNGVDLIRWDEHGRVTDFTVMIRPAKGLQAVQQRMAAMLTGGAVPPPA